jgi:arylsulfatase A-like enzyme
MRLAILLSCVGPTVLGGQAFDAGSSSRGSVPSSVATPAMQQATTPKLLVFIAVDQMRPDYFTRFHSQLKGGLARLYDGGAVFTNAYQDHAITETAPGHSTMMSGRFPRSTGIVQNLLGVEDSQAPLIEGFGPGASPARFRGTVLADWVRAKDPRTRVLSISRKDRGAILPVGRLKTQVLWYGSNGGFTTSRYYADTLPSWVQQLNARHLAYQWVGKSWTPLLPDREYSEVDSVPAEGAGRDFVFPHQMLADTARAMLVLPNYPWMDELTLQYALQGLKTLSLGSGPQTDILAISLSTTDAVGHRYGPDSKEVHDNILRLDRALGVFFDSLYAQRDPSSIIVALTADHGVGPFPEVKSHDPNAGAQYVTAIWDTLFATRARLSAAGVDSAAFDFDAPFLMIHRDAFAKTRLSADSVVLAFAKSMRAIPGVMRADLYRDLARADTTRDAISRRWLHMFPDGFPVDLVVTLKPYNYWGRGIAFHGTPHDYDAHVPLIFYGAPFKPGTYGEMARVVDAAPTLAEVLKATPSERLDGHVLRSALR